MMPVLMETPRVRADYTTTIDPAISRGVWEGWGCSLAWWANLAGGFANRATYADLAFTQLKLNIVRYNIGGGENPNIANTLQFRARVPGFQPSPGVWNWAADANQRWMLKAAVARGANRVVASLWSVNDAATAELMAAFYQGMLRDKLAPASALQKAQAQMWKRSRWKSPYFWAAFQIQGDWK